MPNLESPRASSLNLSEYIRRNEQTWKEGYETEGNIWGYNSYYTEPLKEDQTYNNDAWDSKMDDYNEESKGYYQEHRANYGDSQMKQRFRRVTRWREHRVERLDRRMETENTAPWHIIQKSTKRFVRFQEDFWH